MSDSSAVILQYLMPKKALTQFAGFVAGGRWGGVTQWIIRDFIKRYNVNMAETDRKFNRIRIGNSIA